MTQRDDLRKEYKRSDFVGRMVRGKYAERLREASNIVVLKPEIAAAFPNGEAVNRVLKSLIEVAQAAICVKKQPTRRGKKRRAA